MQMTVRAGRNSINAIPTLSRLVEKEFLCSVRLFLSDGCGSNSVTSECSRRLNSCARKLRQATQCSAQINSKSARMLTDPAHLRLDLLRLMNCINTQTLPMRTQNRA